MNASFSVVSLLILVALATMPIVLWGLSSTWQPVLKLPARLFAAVFGLFVLWIIVVNTLFFMGLEH